MKQTFHYVLAFEFINRAPETTENNTIDNVIKIFFHETSNDEPYEAVAIDLEHGEVYGNPSLSVRGVTGNVVVDSERSDFSRNGTRYLTLCPLTLCPS